MLHKEKEKIIIIILSYITAITASIFFITFPDYFLLPSVSKMYFTNYYNPGTYNIIRIIFLYVLMVPYMVYEMHSTLKTVKSELEHKQNFYFYLTIIIGYAIGFIPNFLIYDIPIDPLWGMLFATLFLIPFAYGAIQYQLFNIKVIAKQAFIYSVSVFIVGGIIILFNYSNGWILSSLPNFPIWVSPIISAIMFVTISFLVWNNLRQSDVLKYEFITTVTHKFRTPLTYVKWATESLLNPEISTEDRISQVKYIQIANSKLVELTNLLVNVSDSENKDYCYQIKKVDFSKVIIDIVDTFENNFATKKLSVIKNIEPNIEISGDISRISFVIQVLVENAIHYSYKDGKIVISFKKDGNGVIFSVTDHGIGISKDNMNLIFSKFYRSDTARKNDTEGMGIGLFIAKQIIGKHLGKIWATSEGQGKGSMFAISLPLK